MKAVTLSLMFILVTTVSALSQTAAEPGEASSQNQADAAPELTTEVSECLEQEASAFYACLEDDLIEAEFFVAGGGISQSDAPLVGVETAVEENALSEVAAEGELVPGALETNPTAYIDLALVWTAQAAGDRNRNGILEIPVCWINPSEEDQEGRDLTQQAVRNTWEVHAPIRFTGWTRCQEGATGAVRIRIADENPRSYVGQFAATQPTSMWLNFTFDQWSPVCRNRQDSINRQVSINWNNCVHSIAVHEFGHLLGYLHEHDRLFHGADIHMLTEDQLQQRIAACRRVGVTDPTTRAPVSQPLVSAYDPFSVMNYCFNIYDHEVHLSSFDIAGLQRAYTRSNYE